MTSLCSNTYLTYSLMPWFLMLDAAVVDILVYEEMFEWLVVIKVKIWLLYAKKKAMR